MDAKGSRDSRRSQIIGSLVLLVLSVFPLKAADIRGRAADNAGAHVSGAIAVLRDSRRRELKRTTANGEGEFAFSDVAEGKYQIEILPPADYECAKPVKRNIRVKGAEPMLIELRLDFTLCMMERS